jgi:hypothetical protein
MKGFAKLPVRFFIYSDETESEEVDVVEVDESAFLEAQGEIEYQRDTVYQNGVAQICLTKRNGY